MRCKYYKVTDLNTLILSSHLCVGPPSGLFFQVLSKVLQTYLTPYMSIIYSIHLTFFNLITQMTFNDKYKYKTATVPSFPQILRILISDMLNP